MGYVQLFCGSRLRSSSIRDQGEFTAKDFSTLSRKFLKTLVYFDPKSEATIWPVLCSSVSSKQSARSAMRNAQIETLLTEMA